VASLFIVTLAIKVTEATFPLPLWSSPTTTLLYQPLPFNTSAANNPFIDWDPYGIDNNPVKKCLNLLLFTFLLSFTAKN
jgi:hypothetical protein